MRPDTRVKKLKGNNYKTVIMSDPWNQKVLQLRSEASKQLYHLFLTTSQVTSYSYSVDSASLITAYIFQDKL